MAIDQLINSLSATSTSEQIPEPAPSQTDDSSISADGDRQDEVGENLRFSECDGKAEYPSDEVNTPENRGLAMAAAAEAAEDEVGDPSVIYIMSALSCSPMFRAAVRDYGKDLIAAIPVGEMDDSGDEWCNTMDATFDIRMFAARMFLGGVLAERSAGNTNNLGRRHLDS